MVVPLWLGWPPALLAMLSCGLVCVVLTWIWSVDARWSGTVANLLAGSGATVKPASRDGSLAPRDLVAVVGCELDALGKLL